MLRPEDDWREAACAPTMDCIDTAHKEMTVPTARHTHSAPLDLRHRATASPARRQLAPPIRRRRPATGVGLLIAIGAGVLAVFAVVAATAPLGVLGAAAAFLTTILALAAILTDVFRLLGNESDER
jgi:hypothetical protein